MENAVMVGYSEKNKFTFHTKTDLDCIVIEQTK